MSELIDPTLLPPLSEWISAETGLYFPPERWPDLERGMAAACRNLGFQSVEEGVYALISGRLNAQQKEMVAAHLTVGETYFMREPEIFDALEQYLREELIPARQKEKCLRLWSAGCATGEEAYSLALFFREKMPQLQDWRIVILGSDLNTRSLQRAMQGAYREWSFRDTPSWVKGRYFTRGRDQLYRLNPAIKEMVKFSCLNLSESVYPSLATNTAAMDVILCRNVLMYFSAERANQVIERLHLSLVESGLLVVGACEVSLVQCEGFAHYFQPLPISRSLIFKKINQQPGPLGAAIPAWRGEEAACVWLRESPIAAESPESRMEIPPEPAFDKSAEVGMGFGAEAAELWKSCLAAHPEDANLLGQVARAYGNQGKLAEALQWCGKALAYDKLNPEFHFLTGSILQELGHLQEAVASFQRVLFLEPDFVLAHFALGNLALQQNGRSEAGKHFGTALSLLDKMDPASQPPQAEGITAGQLKEMILSSQPLA
jgi:chemotaxis protein methyltransferase CheR